MNQNTIPYQEKVPTLPTKKYCVACEICIRNREGCKPCTFNGQAVCEKCVKLYLKDKNGYPVSNCRFDVEDCRQGPTSKEKKCKQSKPMTSNTQKRKLTEGSTTQMKKVIRNKKEPDMKKNKMK